MKYLITILAFIISGSALSQVIVGDEAGSNPNPSDTGFHSSALLDFHSARDNSGIILPYVRVLPQTTDGLVEGTLILDATNPAQAAVKYYNGSWVDLSSNNRADVTAEMDDQPLLGQVIEDPDAQMIIGDENTTASGVLVLEANDKAMILPMVSDTDKIVNPSPGMMVYLNKSGAKRLAVFNGNKWTFWKPDSN